MNMGTPYSYKYGAGVGDAPCLKEALFLYDTGIDDFQTPYPSIE